ncbi:MAG: hypothetical protein ACRDRH_06335 [Pseudonocardia sp.]
MPLTLVRRAVERSRDDELQKQSGCRTDAASGRTAPAGQDQFRAMIASWGAEPNQIWPFSHPTGDHARLAGNIKINDIDLTASTPY